MSVIEQLKAEKGLIGVRRVAELLGSHKQTIYEWCWDGTLPFMRVRGRLKIDPEVVVEFLVARGS